MKRRIRAVVFTSLCMTLPEGIVWAQSSLVPAARPRYSAETTPVPFELFRNSRIILNGTVNGVPTTMMLDNGAGLTSVDRTFAQEIGLKRTKKKKASLTGDGKRSTGGEIAENVTLVTGGLELGGLSVVIFDLTPAMRGIGHQISVILGRDAFKAGIVTIDFPRQRIFFQDRAAFKPPPLAARLDLENDGWESIAPIAVVGKRVNAEIDLGSNGTLLLSNQAWADRPELVQLRHAESQVVGVDGVTPTRSVTLPELTIGNTRFADVPAKLSEDPKAGPAIGANVGIQLLRNFIVTFDLGGGALYLQEPGLLQPYFERDRAGVRLELDGTELKVVYVSPEGPAASAGLKAGDRIVAVDGRRVDSRYYDRPDWTHADAGTIVLLERSDGSKVQMTLADFY